MPVPKRKRSRARRDSRFANKFIKPKAIAACKQCQEPISTHTACKSCGYYKGVKVLTPKAERAGKRMEVRKAQAASRAARAPQEAAESEK